MPDETVDPSGNTEAFRAFSNSPQEQEAPAPSKLPIVIGGAVLLAAVIALVLWLAL